MNTYYVTFGVQYPREPHPWVPWADKAGWLTVIAPDENTARLLTGAVLGNKWAFIYEQEDFNPDHYPKGELARITYQVTP